MTKVIVSMIIMGLLSVSGLAEETVWVRVAGTPKMDIYVDFDRIKHSGNNTLEVWTKLELKKQELNTTKPTEDIMAYMEYDCRQNKHRIVPIMTYFKDGEIISEDSEDLEYVIPDDAGERIVETVCVYADKLLNRKENK